MSKSVRRVVAVIEALSEMERESLARHLAVGGRNGPLTGWELWSAATIDAWKAREGQLALIGRVLCDNLLISMEKPNDRTRLWCQRAHALRQDPKRPTWEVVYKRLKEQPGCPWRDAASLQQVHCRARKKHPEWFAIDEPVRHS